MDTAKAIERGVAKKVRKIIEDFLPGDVFDSPFAYSCVVAQVGYGDKSDEYAILGRNGKFMPFSDTGGVRTKREVLDFLNRNHYVFVRRISLN